MRYFRSELSCIFATCRFGCKNLLKLLKFGFGNQKRLWHQRAFPVKNRIPPVEDINFLSEGVISKIVTDFRGGM